MKRQDKHILREKRIATAFNRRLDAREKWRIALQTFEEANSQYMRELYRADKELDLLLHPKS